MPPQKEIPTTDKPAEEIIKMIENQYPLPNDKKSIKWENFDVTHRIGSGGFG